MYSIIKGGIMPLHIFICKYSGLANSWIEFFFFQTYWQYFEKGIAETMCYFKGESTQKGNTS